jgi:hypothetical protein
MHSNRRLFALLVVAGIGFAGCGGVPGGGSEEPPRETAAKVQPIKGTDLTRILLSRDATRVLGIKTAAVRRIAAGRLTVPYAAVLYGPEGDTFTYTNPGPGVYVQHPIAVTRIRGAFAVLKQGPPAGTPVVTVGASELLGARDGVEE